MQVALLEPAAAAAEGTKEMKRRETSGSIDRVKEMPQIEFHCRTGLEIRVIVSKSIILRTFLRGCVLGVVIEYKSPSMKCWR